MTHPTNSTRAVPNRRLGRRRRNGNKTYARPNLNDKSISGIGCTFAPIGSADLEQINDAALTLLAKTGLAEPSATATRLITAAGGELNADTQRLVLPKKLVRKVLNGIQRKFSLSARGCLPHLQLAKHHVHVGTGGASPNIFDLPSRRYRNSKLADLFAAARIVDSLDHFHFFSRPVVARDMPDPLSLDINTAYASLLGTLKHVMVSASSVASVKAIASMCYAVAGSKQKFCDAPFLSLNINHAVPPMRFDPDACDVLIAAAQHGLPVMVNTFGQLGASSPVTLAGCIAQTTAETLAGMVIAYLAAPDVKAVFGPRPMVTDLRSGAMSGGSGEQALLTAGAVQMAQYYDLPSSTIAGATDSKMPDTQSGYEKCLAVSLAVQAGANLITQAGGTQASLMGLSLESLVIDNDMLGGILRAVSPIEVNPTTLSVDNISAVVNGPGHFLGESQTYARMNSDFLYPKIADRDSLEVWESSGSSELLVRAHDSIKTILSAPASLRIDPKTDSKIRNHFDIQLPYGA